jgi:hypothetical protein
LIDTRQISIFAPSERKTDCTKSCSPTETPPVMIRMWFLIPCLMASVSDSRLSPECSAEFTIAPQRFSNACSNAELLS